MSDSWSESAWKDTSSAWDWKSAWSDKDSKGKWYDRDWKGEPPCQQWQGEWSDKDFKGRSSNSDWAGRWELKWIKDDHEPFQETYKALPQESDARRPRESDAQRSKGEPRHWAHIFLFPRHPQFEFVPMMIGRKGVNVKGIFKKTDAKLRIRGKGSNYLEGPDNQEAKVPLMVAVTTAQQNAEGFYEAIELTIKLLEEIEGNYRKFCWERLLPIPPQHERMFCLGESAEISKKVLNDLAVLYPHPAGPRPIKKVTPGGNSAEKEDDPPSYLQDTPKHSTASSSRRSPKHVPPPDRRASEQCINYDETWSGYRLNEYTGYDGFQDWLPHMQGLDNAAHYEHWLQQVHSFGDYDGSPQVPWQEELSPTFATEAAVVLTNGVLEDERVAAEEDAASLFEDMSLSISDFLAGKSNEMEFTAGEPAFI
jgi:hypothetical protein